MRHLSGLFCRTHDEEREVGCYKCWELLELEIEDLQSKLKVCVEAFGKIKQESTDECGGCNLKGYLAKEALALIKTEEG